MDWVVQDQTLGPDQQVQVSWSVVWDFLHEGGDGGQEGLHVEGGVKNHHISHQAVNRTGRQIGITKHCLHRDQRCLLQS